MKIKFGEGKYDNVVALVRRKTNARHVLAIILDGVKGSGFAIHIAGVTQAERVAYTKQMIVAVAQLGRALVDGVERMQAMTDNEVVKAMHDESVGNDPTIEAQGFDLQPSPPRCSHCGANLPATPPSPPAPGTN